KRESSAEEHPLVDEKKDFVGNLSMRGVVPKANALDKSRAGGPSSPSKKSRNTLEGVISGGSMAVLSGYKDLSKAPMSFGDEDMPMSTLAAEPSYERTHSLPPTPQFSAQELPHEVDTEFSGNVKTLIRLVNELPEGVTKQTG